MPEQQGPETNIKDHIIRGKTGPKEVILGAKEVQGKNKLEKYGPEKPEDIKFDREGFKKQQDVRNELAQEQAKTDTSK